MLESKVALGEWGKGGKPPPPFEKNKGAKEVSRILLAFNFYFNESLKLNIFYKKYFPLRPSACHVFDIKISGRGVGGL